jgi:hypothetical protein
MTLHGLVLLLLPPSRPGRVFSARERRTLAAAAEVLLKDVDFPIAADDVIANVERFIGGSRRAWRVRALLALVEAAPLASGQAPFSRLAPAARARVIRERFASNGRVWALCRRIRPLVLLGAYASPDARRRVGWIDVPDRPRFRLSVAEAVPS